MRTFTVTRLPHSDLTRHANEVCAEGVQFSDGAVAIRWRRHTRSGFEYRTERQKDMDYLLHNDWFRVDWS